MRGDVGDLTRQRIEDTLVFFGLSRVARLGSRNRPVAQQAAGQEGQGRTAFAAAVHPDRHTLRIAAHNVGAVIANGQYRRGEVHATDGFRLELRRQDQLRVITRRDRRYSHGRDPRPCQRLAHPGQFVVTLRIVVLVPQQSVDDDQARLCGGDGAHSAGGDLGGGRRPRGAHGLIPQHVLAGGTVDIDEDEGRRTRLRLAADVKRPQGLGDAHRRIDASGFETAQHAAQHGHTAGAR